MQIESIHHRLPSSFLIASIWLAIGLCDATQTVFAMRAVGMHHAWFRLFLTLLFSWLPWALATPFAILLGRRFPPVHRHPLHVWFIHLLAILTMSAIAGAWDAWMLVTWNPYLVSPPPGPLSELSTYKFYNGLLSSFLLYSFILAVSYVLDSRERISAQKTEAARLNEQLSKEQLNALRRQIEPHFLFNTLNTIAGLVREKRNDAAVEMIAGLSDFLRRVLENSDHQHVPLAEELEFAHKYLDIQKMRFAARLQVSVDVPQELWAAQVPSLILQPMVENAVKHGIAKRMQGGAIRIAAFQSNGTLTLRVYNDGPYLPEEWEKIQAGVGIPNVRTRLQALYGNAFQLTMRNQPPGGVEVSVSLPFDLSPNTPPVASLSLKE
jgi:two-component system, LytTR family, sensor kinase